MAPKIGVWIDLCQAFNGHSMIVLLPQVSADYRLVVKHLPDSRAERAQAKAISRILCAVCRSTETSFEMPRCSIVMPK